MKVQGVVNRLSGDAQIAIVVSPTEFGLLYGAVISAVAIGSAARETKLLGLEFDRAVRDLEGDESADSILAEGVDLKQRFDGVMQRIAAIQQQQNENADPVPPADETVRPRPFDCPEGSCEYCDALRAAQVSVPLGDVLAL